jgi:hypothetical protein
MNNIFPITYTRVQKIERKAKLRRKADSDLKVAASLDLAAREDGFLHWHHVKLCRSLGEREKQRASLPPRLNSILAGALKRFPASESTASTFSKGIVVAIDVADAHRLDRLERFVEFTDGWHLAAKDIWPSALLGMRAAHPKDDELALDRRLLDDITRFRFFAVDVGSDTLTSQQLIVDLVPAPVAWCWIQAKVSRISDGLWNGPSRTRQERFRHLASDIELSFIAKESHEMAESSFFQIEKRTPLGQLRYQPVSASFSMHWKDAQSIRSE